MCIQGLWLISSRPLTSPTLDEDHGARILIGRMINYPKGVFGALSFREGAIISYPASFLHVCFINFYKKPHRPRPKVLVPC